MGALGITVGGAFNMHNYSSGSSIMLGGFIIVIMVMIVWWRDVIREATFQGNHTAIVQRGLRWGMILFILSEVCFFFSFFWAFFHSALAPAVELGATWPPYGIEGINPFDVPLLNTALLVASGAAVTYGHHATIAGDKHHSIVGLLITIVLGVIFTGVQAFEYIEAPFTIADSVYGSCFFVATGFHGLHVLIGTTFLFVCICRLIYNQLTSGHHVGYEASIWYWHFVDIVWIFLYVTIYWWGY